MFYMMVLGGCECWEFMFSFGEMCVEMELDECICILFKFWCNVDDIVIECKVVYCFYVCVVDMFSKGCVFFVGDVVYIMLFFVG